MKEYPNLYNLFVLNMHTKDNDNQIYTTQYSTTHYGRHDSM